MTLQINHWINDKCNKRTITSATITDDNGIVWEYDAYSYVSNRRELRIPVADKELPEEYQSENGYDARSLDEALLILLWEGYINDNCN